MDKPSIAQFQFDLGSLNQPVFPSSMLSAEKTTAPPVQELDKAFLEFVVGSHEASRDLLMKASRRFRAVLKIESGSLDAHYGLALTLFELFQVTHERHFLTSSLKHFNRAEAICTDSKNFGLYWDAAKAHAAHVEHSNEPSDYAKLYSVLEKACSASLTPNSQVYHRMAATALKMGQLTRDIRFYTRALELDRIAISLSPSSSRSWLLFGITCHEIYLKTWEEDQAHAADQAFANAAQFGSEEDELFFTWGCHLAAWGKMDRNAQRCAAALDKFAKVENTHSYEATLFSLETEALLGLFTEQYELLQKARHEIEAIIDGNDPDPASLLTYGKILMNLGTYFESADLYYLAIEKFQEGISLNNAIPELWHGLASGFVATADYGDEPVFLAKAAGFYARAIELAPQAAWLFDYASILRRLSEIKKDKQFLERALLHFEQAILYQKHNIYLFPKGLFEFALALEQAGVETNDESFYLRSIDLLQRLSILQPDCVDYYTKIGLIQAALADLRQEVELYRQASQFFRSAHRMASENDLVLLDWAITLMNICELSDSAEEVALALDQAKQKILQAAKLGNQFAYYHMACIYAFEGKTREALVMLEKADEKDGLPPFDEVSEDSWLESLRGHEVFDKLLEKLQNRSN